MKVLTYLEKDFCRNTLTTILDVILWDQTLKTDLYVNVLTGTNRTNGRRHFELGYSKAQDRVYFRDCIKLKPIAASMRRELFDKQNYETFVNTIDQCLVNSKQVKTIDYHTSCDCYDQVLENLKVYKDNDIKNIFRFFVQEHKPERKSEVIIEKRNSYIHLLLKDEKENFLWEDMVRKDNFDISYLSRTIWESLSPITIVHNELEMER